MSALARRSAAALAVIGLVALAAYLVFWPVPVDPVAWRPAPPPDDPRFAPNGGLRGLRRLGAAEATGPEAVTVDAAGRVVTGTNDGRLLRVDAETGAVEELARTGGRPLGLAFDLDGSLWICDAVLGLLHRDPSGALRVVATAHAGVPFGFPDDVDVGPDGTVYFTDASSKFRLHHDREDILEHGGHGRLLAYHPSTKRTELLLSGPPAALRQVDRHRGGHRGRHLPGRLKLWAPLRAGSRGGASYDSSRSRCSGSHGFARWPSNPASMAPVTSSGWA